MAGRRTFTKRFLFASRAIHRRRRPDVEVLEGRALLATLTVNSLSDAGIGSNNAGDLRYCINQANADDQANTIVFDSTVFRTPQTITLSGGQLELSDTGGAQTITGPAAKVTISGGGDSRVFQVDGDVTASISGLTISGGLTSTGNGGGLDNDGTLTLTDCTVSGDTAGFGGGVYNSGTAKFTGCTISGDTAYSPVDGGYGVFNGGTGGGVYNASSANLTVTGCTFTGNSAGEDGGLSNLGTANLTDCALSANSGGGVGNDAGTATLTDCTISGNSDPGGWGGGVFNRGITNLTLTDCTISGNSASYGGGVFNFISSNLTMTDCTVSGNSGGSGGGLSNSGTATLTGCAISGNGGWGVFNGATANLTDCTLSGNGAGVYNSAPGNLTMTDCTVSGNSYGVINSWAATLTDTIVAGNTDSSSAHDIASSDDISGSYNLIGTGGSGGLVNGVNGNIVLTSLTDLGLAPLGNNGGPTQTMALLPGSPALGAGIAVSGVTTDQRGVPRGNVLDIGAYQATATQLDLSGFPSSTASGVSHSFTVNAVDPFGQPALDFNSPVTFSSSDPSATLPTGGSLVAGQGTFTATLNTPGVRSITASAGGLIGSQTGITVSAPATASFLEQDTTTQGSWMGVYGAQGYDIVSGPTSLPAGDTVTPKGQSTYTWTTTSTDPRALQVPGSTSRVAAVWYSATSFTVDVNLADGQTHDLELYFLDWDSKGRSEQVQLSDAGTGKVLATETISSFTNGVYLDWKVSGDVLITITRTAGANAVLNGLFLDSTTTPTPTATATASFLEHDTTTQGSWMGVYGA